MIKPCISNFGENYLFHFHFLFLFFNFLFIYLFIFFFANKSDFVLTKFCVSICRDVLRSEPFNLHDLYSCIDSNECFYALLSISLVEI